MRHVQLGRQRNDSLYVILRLATGVIQECHLLAACCFTPLEKLILQINGKPVTHNPKTLCDFVLILLPTKQASYKRHKNLPAVVIYFNGARSVRERRTRAN